MTREEAVAVLKAFMENPLFGDTHKAAFNIAIHDIKAYHKWNLNELVLTQKDNEQEPILDKLRAEILEEHENAYAREDNDTAYGLSVALEIIDKYKAETEETDGTNKQA